jgi:glycosyltransferase involved in cell wall biosynthesis
MTEVGGPSAFYIDPADPEGAAALLADVLRQPEAERQACIEAGRANAARFTSARMIGEYIEVYRQLAATGEARA